MTLYTSSFDNRYVCRINSYAFWLMFPVTWMTNTLLSFFQHTTKEIADRYEDPCYERYLMLTCLVPVIVIFIILTFPLSAVAFCVWAPLQRYKHPVTYTGTSIYGKCLMDECLETGLDLHIASVDTGLYSEYEARQQNLAHTQNRARSIATAIVEPQIATSATKGGEEIQLLNTTALKISSYTEAEANNVNEKEPSIAESITEDKDLQHSIDATFPPDLDIVCFQGVFDTRAQNKMKDILIAQYPYVVFDVGINSWKTNRYRQGSGLMIASKYPFLDAKFNHFISFGDQDKSKSKGVLLTKLGLGTSGGQNIVGYIANVHLLAGVGMTDARSEQLTEMKEWLSIFRSETVQDNELVAVDIICGNLEFDTMSTAEAANWNHPLISEYMDPCRQCLGKDKSWVIGTELVKERIYKPQACTPLALKRSLEDPAWLIRFVTDVHLVQDEESDMVVAQRLQGRRRTSLILYKPNTQDASLNTICHEYRFITQLAGLTVHIPVVSAFKIHRYLPSNPFR